jgi:hypothetical protein
MRMTTTLVHGRKKRRVAFMPSAGIEVTVILAPICADIDLVKTRLTRYITVDIGFE